MTAPPLPIPIRLTLWFFACLAISAPLDSRAADPPNGRRLPDRYTHTSYVEGLPQNTVKSILQTSDGYLWFGTRFGLVRFDGVNFRVFDQSSQPALLDENCNSLIEDRVDGTLWIGHVDHVTSFKNNRFTTFELTKNPSQERTRQYCAASDGGLWIATDNGLLRFKDGRIARRFGVSEGLQTNALNTLFLDATNILWVGTDMGLQTLDTTSGQVAGPVPPDDRLTSMTSCVYKAAGELWVANLLGLHVLRDGLWHTISGAVTGSNPIDFVVRDSTGLIWTGGRGTRLQCLAEGESVTFNPPDSFMKEALCMITDREGNLWIGTQYDGVSRLRPHQIETWDTQHGLAHNDVWSIFQARDGAIWLGCSDGICELKGENIHMHMLPATPAPPTVKSIYQDQSGTMWAGSGTLGLLRQHEGHWEPIPHPGQEFPSRVSAIFEDRRGILWVGTRNDLLLREAGKLSAFQWRPGEGVLNVRAICEDRSGNLWFGTYRKGLYRWRDGQMTIYRTEDGLPSNCAWTLHEDNDGDLWVGTDNGLARFNDGRFSSFTRRQGLFDNVVNSILEDSHENLWISCNRGIYQVARSALDEVAAGHSERINCTPFGTADGMPARETNGGSQPSAFKTRDGALWFPTIKGAVRIDPEKATRNSLPPLLVIEDLIVNGHRLDIAAVLRLAAGSGNKLEIHYTGNSFMAPEKVLFSHCLDGCDQDWSEPTSNRIASYTNLRPGNYTFQVKACNNHGVWNENPAMFSFSIAPFFYQTGWFLAACAGATILVVFGLHRIRIRVVTQIQRLHQQHALERERARIAQEMHDDLGASLTQIGLLGELAQRHLAQPSAAEQHLRKIKETAGDLFRGLDEIVWAVNPKHDTLPSLADYLCKHAQQYLPLAGIRVRIERPGELPDVSLSSEHRHNVFLAFKEALNNVVKHAAASEVWLRFRVEEGQLDIDIEDNGRGFNPASVDPSRHGLANMRQRLQTIGGRFEPTSSPGNGASIRFVLPAQLSQTTTRVRRRPSPPEEPQHTCPSS